MSEGGGHADSIPAAGLGGSRLAALSPFLQLENSHTPEALEFERSPAGEDRSLLLEKGTRRPAGTGCLQ